MILKIFNKLLNMAGLQVITAEDYEKGRRDTEAMNRLQDVVNPQCKHGSRVNWCDECEKESPEDKYYD